jgi:hypothetical protein
MRKLHWLILYLVFIVACSEQRPADVLPEDKMREVMWDMIKAGEFLDGYVFGRDSIKNKAALATDWNNKVYELHRITKDQFDKSYTYYKGHPALMKGILDSLGKRNAPVPVTATDSTVKPVPPVKDSIRGKTNQSFILQKKDSVPAIIAPKLRENLPVNNFKQRKAAIVDSVKRFRMLQRQQRLEQ